MSNYIVTDTELTAVANAIRNKGGTSASLEWNADFISAINAISGGGAKNILGGTAAPNTSVGSDGDVYLQYLGPINYIKFTISKIRSIGGMQLSELKFYDKNDTEITLPQGTSITANATAYSSSEPVENLIDGSTNTKYYTSTVPSSSSPIEIIISLGDENSDIGSWEWYTANDSNGRDPVSFALSVSNDGVDYIQIDSAVDANIPTTRKALAYSSNLNIGEDCIIGTYCKVNGAWQDLIGTDISDVNTGVGTGNTPNCYVIDKTLYVEDLSKYNVSDKSLNITI